MHAMVSFECVVNKWDFCETGVKSTTAAGRLVG